MAYRALIFSKDPETNSAVVSGCREAELGSDSCADIFAAIKSGTKQPYSCVIVDWADQPEAGFLLKRARDSALNREVVVIAIVDHDPTAAELRDHGLHFFIYRSIVATETKEVLAKALANMQPSADGDRPDTNDIEETSSAASADASLAAEPEPPAHEAFPQPSPETQFESTELEDGTSEAEEEHVSFRPAFSWRQAAAVALVLAAAYFVWNARGMITYLAHTPESKAKIFKEAVTAFFNLNPSATTPLSATGSDAHQDAYYSRGPAGSSSTAAEIGVVATQADLVEARVNLRGPADFPLPEVTFTPPPLVPVHTERAPIPDSLRGAAPLTRPVVVAVNPAQMMPVSAPMTPPIVTQGFSEPVAVSEEEQRALLIHNVNATYPPEALPQKLHGSVVLQATISREGNVEDVKIVHGYMLLGKAAAAAVKQWKFRPYMIDGHAAQTQTTITINFNLPPA